jgi:hypothetical protein
VYYAIFETEISHTKKNISHTKNSQPYLFNNNIYVCTIINTTNNMKLQPSQVIYVATKVYSGSSRIRPKQFECVYLSKRSKKQAKKKGRYKIKYLIDGSWDYVYEAQITIKKKATRSDEVQMDQIVIYREPNSPEPNTDTKSNKQSPSVKKSSSNRSNTSTNGLKRTSSVRNESLSTTNSDAVHVPAKVSRIPPKKKSKQNKGGLSIPPTASQFYYNSIANDLKRTLESDDGVSNVNSAQPDPGTIPDATDATYANIPSKKKRKKGGLSVAPSANPSHTVTNDLPDTSSTGNNSLSETNSDAASDLTSPTSPTSRTQKKITVITTQNVPESAAIKAAAIASGSDSNSSSSSSNSGSSRFSGSDISVAKDQMFNIVEYESRFDSDGSNSANASNGANGANGSSGDTRSSGSKDTNNSVSNDAIGPIAISGSNGSNESSVLNGSDTPNNDVAKKSIQYEKNRFDDSDVSNGGTQKKSTAQKVIKNKLSSTANNGSSGSNVSNGSNDFNGSSVSSGSNGSSGSSGSNDELGPIIRQYEIMVQNKVQEIIRLNVVNEHLVHDARESNERIQQLEDLRSKSEQRAVEQDDESKIQLMENAIKQHVATISDYETVIKQHAATISKRDEVITQLTARLQNCKQVITQERKNMSTFKSKILGLASQNLEKVKEELNSYDSSNSASSSSKSSKSKTSKSNNKQDS